MTEAKLIVCPGPDCTVVFTAGAPAVNVPCCGSKLCLVCSQKPIRNKHLCVLCDRQTTPGFDVKAEPKKEKANGEPELKRQKLDTDQSPGKSLEEMFVEKFLAAKAMERGAGIVTEVEKKKFLDVLEKKLNAMTKTPIATTSSEVDNDISEPERSVQQGGRVVLPCEKPPQVGKDPSSDETIAAPPSPPVVAGPSVLVGPILPDCPSTNGITPPEIHAFEQQNCPTATCGITRLRTSPVETELPLLITDVVGGQTSSSVLLSTDRVRTPPSSTLITKDRKTPPSSAFITNDQETPPRGLLTPPSSRNSSPSSESPSPSIRVRAEFSINHLGLLVDNENVKVNEELRKLGLPIQFFGETLNEKRYRLEEASKLLAPIIPVATPEPAKEEPKTPITSLSVDQFLKGIAAIHMPKVLEAIQQNVRKPEFGPQKPEQEKVSRSNARKPISPPSPKQPEQKELVSSTVTTEHSSDEAFFTKAITEEKKSGVWIQVEDLSSEERACLPKHVRMNGLVSKRKIQEWLKGVEGAKAETTAETNSLGGCSDKSSNSDKDAIVDCPCGNKCLLSQCKEFRNMFPAAKREYLTRAILCWNCFKLGHDTDDCTGKWRDVPKDQFKECIFCFQPCHTMLKCPLYFYLPVEQQEAFLSAQSICYNCFRTGHRSRDCPDDRKCDFSDCTLYTKHHPRAHDYHKLRRGNKKKLAMLKSQKKIYKVSSSAPCMYCDSSEHRIEKCSDFGDLPLKRRVRYVATRKICFNCFGKGHTYAGCTYPKSCRREGCKVQIHHHTFFHEHFGIKEAHFH